MQMSIRNHIAYVEPGTGIEATWDVATRSLKIRQGFRTIGNCPADRPSDALLALEYFVSRTWSASRCWTAAIPSPPPRRNDEVPGGVPPRKSANGLPRTLHGTLLALNMAIGKCPADFPPPVVSVKQDKALLDGVLWDGLEVEWWLATHPAPAIKR